MSRADHARALQLVRLRDLAMAASLRELAEANAAFATADAAAVQAAAQQDAATARHAEARAALVARPADVATGLARIDLAAVNETLAAELRVAADAARDTAAGLVVAAQLRVRRAQAQLDAMTARADTLRRALSRQAEERVASEAEDTMTKAAA